MSGLDKMKSRIFEEAEQSAAELLDQAKKDAEKIVKDAVEKAGADAEHILLYGGIEENCTIKAVFDAKREELADVVKRQLFS